MLVFELNGRSPSTTVTFATSHPSRSIITETIAFTGLALVSTSRAALRAPSMSPFVMSPFVFVWITSVRSPPKRSGYWVASHWATSSASSVLFSITKSRGLRPTGAS